MKISDELRDYGRRLVSNASPFNCTFGDIRAYQDELADRIDSEMVELPRDRDGAPIHIGDTVYLDDGRKVHVSRVNIARDHTSIDSVPHGNGPLFFAIEPTRFTHIRPDSWERIAEDLEGLSVDSAVSDINLVSACALDLAKRIRRLAKKEDQR